MRTAGRTRAACLWIWPSLHSSAWCAQRESTLQMECRQSALAAAALLVVALANGCSAVGQAGLYVDRYNKLSAVAERQCMPDAGATDSQQRRVTGRGARGDGPGGGGRRFSRRRGWLPLSAGATVSFEISRLEGRMRWVHTRLVRRRCHKRDLVCVRPANPSCSSGGGCSAWCSLLSLHGLHLPPACRAWAQDAAGRLRHSPVHWGRSLRERRVQVPHGCDCLLAVWCAGGVWGDVYTCGPSLAGAAPDFAAALLHPDFLAAKQLAILGHGCLLINQC